MVCAQCESCRRNPIFVAALGNFVWNCNFMLLLRNYASQTRDCRHFSQPQQQVVVFVVSLCTMHTPYAHREAAPLWHAMLCP